MNVLETDRLVLRRSVLGLERIVAITVPDNESSIRLLEKLGMRFERTIRWEDGAEVKLFGMNQ